MRLPDERLLPLALILGLAACGRQGDTRPLASAPATSGPLADFPMVLGDPFTVDGKRYTPADTLNYDEVGTAILDGEGGQGITAAHRMLPLPSYVEVTSLETGRTILVRNERRGPMNGPFLIALSPGAADQLGILGNTPVRVRRVNPPEQERALLRQGARAPERMETPKSLVEVLRRKLPGRTLASTAVTSDTAPAVRPAPPFGLGVDGALVAKPGPASVPATTAVPEPPKTSGVAAAPKPAPAEPRRPASTAATSASAGGLVVQAGAFAVEANAHNVAERIGGRIDRAGKLYLVRTGPFASRGEAEASLAKVKAAGYSGALIKNLN